ncbi:aminoglycoside phosphotransferase family protein [Oceanospirillum sanctuarii]|uniref:aminoglycoside phosphotransferase family protein n=1 Tax=Oceanospirillum sanctuarii TaxID=1434821 RepID=UPI000A395FFD|nr:phosphotransferase [Oceanospirillum sanctuarii]
MTPRYTQLCQWLTQATNISQPELEMVAGDASFRRYYRLNWNNGRTDGQATSYIVMDAPPPEEDCAPFVRIARHWFRQGVHVPEVIAQDLEQGFLLLQDFGDNQLLPNIRDDQQAADRLYKDSIDALIRIQQTSGLELPAYDHELLTREMELFKEWFCLKWLELDLSDEEISLLDHTFEHLCHSALQQKQVPVHRDYHSRNLMLTTDHKIGIIDFQDAVIGPISYDLVSLLKDCYLHWPASLVDQWRNHYLQEAKNAGLLASDYSKDKFRQELDLMGAQRHIKVLGIFSRLWLRDGKSGYLNDIPRTLQHLLEATGEYQNLSRFHQWLLDRIVPAMNQKQQSQHETQQTEGA